MRFSSHILQFFPVLHCFCFYRCYWLFIVGCCFVRKKYLFYLSLRIPTRRAMTTKKSMTMKTKLSVFVVVALIYHQIFLRNVAAATLAWEIKTKEGHVACTFAIQWCVKKFKKFFQDFFLKLWFYAVAKSSCVKKSICWNWLQCSVRKLVDKDVLTAVLAGRRDDGVAGSQPSAKNFRLRNFVVAVHVSLIDFILILNSYAVLRVILQNLCSQCGTLGYSKVTRLE
jgi:hypothetical protein